MERMKSKRKRKMEKRKGEEEKKEEEKKCVRGQRGGVERRGDVSV